MLHRRGGLQSARVASLQAADKRLGQLPNQVRVLAQTFLGAAGPGISRQVHHGCADGQADLLPGVLLEIDAGLVPHLGKCLGENVGIPGLAQARGLRKLGREDGRHAGGPAQPVDAFGKGAEGWNSQPRNGGLVLGEQRHLLCIGQ